MFPADVLGWRGLFMEGGPECNWHLESKYALVHRENVESLLWLHRS